MDECFFVVESVKICLAFFIRQKEEMAAADIEYNTNDPDYAVWMPPAGKHQKKKKLKCLVVLCRALLAHI